MSEKIIHYVIIALTMKQVDEVINKLEDNGLNILAQWLEKNKEKIYGKYQEDWKPFFNQKITEIIEEDLSNSDTKYMSQTELLSHFNKGSNIKILFQDIQIIFIDIFALFLDKYGQLADRCDADFCNMHTSNCCFLINYKLPIEIQEQLEITYKETWPCVSDAYTNGSFHRIAVRVDDVKNFKNMLKIWAPLFKEQSGPNPNTMSNFTDKWGSPRSCPHIR